MYGISRMQADKGAWYWCVNLGRRGKIHQTRFYDTKYGGSAAARKAAIAWRDKQMVELQALTMVEFCQHQRSNNTSGIAGVHFLTSPAQPMGIWQAKLKLGGKSRSRSFSVLAHGFERAFELAVAARAQLLAEADDRPYLINSVAKKAAAKAAAARKGKSSQPATGM